MAGILSVLYEPLHTPSPTLLGGPAKRSSREPRQTQERPWRQAGSIIAKILYDGTSLYDLLERAALLSAFQMTLHLPSWREVTAARAWHCPSSRYGADLERVREHTRLDLRVARESKVCQACKVHVRLLDYNLDYEYLSDRNFAIPLVGSLPLMQNARAG